MAWIESHQELGRHPKTKKLARLLGVSLPTAVGHLQFIWWWSLDYAKDGDLSKYDFADIADAACWEGDPEKFCKAMIESGFLEPDLTIHDWYEYAGRLIEKRAADAERKRKERKSIGQKKESYDIPDDVQRTSDGHPTDGAGTIPNHTIPNHTKPKPEKIKYADSVSLTKDEYEKLVEKYGEAFTQECIVVLDNYKGASGRKYKSDYKAILNWVVDRVEERMRKSNVAQLRPNTKKSMPVYQAPSGRLEGEDRKKLDEILRYLEGRDEPGRDEENRTGQHLQLPAS